MCSVIKDKVKELQPDEHGERRKLVVHVMVEQDSDEAVRFSCRCVWNVTTDSMASATYRSDALFAVAVVFWLAS